MTFEGSMAFADWIDRFAVWNGVHPDLQTLLIYGIGIALYTALVFTFYQLISQRDPAHGKHHAGWWNRTVDATKTALTFPLISFGYFAVMSLALMLMAKETTATSFILLLSMSAVLGVRVTAHISEPMANDLAKLLPLSLLAVVLVDPGYLKLGTMVGRLGDTVALVPVLLQYFVLFILVEAALRGVRAFAPGLGRFWQRHEHHRAVSKKAMLRTIEDDHAGHRKFFHDHVPRASKTQAYVTLDDEHVGKPGRNQGAGPAFGTQRPHVGGSERVSHAPTPKAGPGGKGGNLGSW